MLNDLYAALRTVLENIWPEVIPNGIWEADHIDAVPWDALTVPYAVIAIDSMPRDNRWGAINQVYRPLIHLYYVDLVKGPLSGIRTKLEACDDVLMQTTLSAGQVVAVQGLTWSMSLDPNQVFAGKRMPHRAGRLEVECLIGRVLNAPGP